MIEQLLQQLERLLGNIIILPFLLLILAIQIGFLYCMIRGAIWVGNKLWHARNKAENTIHNHFTQFVDPEIIKEKQEKEQREREIEEFIRTAAKNMKE